MPIARRDPLGVDQPENSAAKGFGRPEPRCGDAEEREFAPIADAVRLYIGDAVMPRPTGDVSMAIDGVLRAARSSSRSPYQLTAVECAPVKNGPRLLRNPRQLGRREVGVPAPWPEEEVHSHERIEAAETGLG